MPVIWTPMNLTLTGCFRRPSYLLDTVGVQVVLRSFHWGCGCCIHSVSQLFRICYQVLAHPNSTIWLMNISYTQYCFFFQGYVLHCERHGGRAPPKAHRPVIGKESFSDIIKPLVGSCLFLIHSYKRLVWTIISMC